MLKKFGNIIILVNFEVITIFLIYDRFEAIRILDARSIFSRHLLIKIFYLVNIKNRTKKTLPKTTWNCCEKRYCFFSKHIYNVLRHIKASDIRKILRILSVESIFSKSKYFLVFTLLNFTFLAKSYRVLDGGTGEVALPSLPPPQSEPLKRTPRLGLTQLLVLTSIHKIWNVKH